jgi:hypothetical protein
MLNKIKNNKLNIIKLNNKTYIPFKIHQLPKYYNKNLEQFNLKGYIYISLNSIKEYSPNFNTLVFHHTLNNKNYR